MEADSSPVPSNLASTRSDPETQTRVATFKAGHKISRFEILQLLGSGGMGEVYRARDTRLMREVAIKVLAPGQDQRRFEQEAHAVAALKHPNIVAIYEYGNEDGFSFLVEEFVEGGSLEQLLRAGPLPLKECLRLAVEIACGLAAAHRAGIIHRDLKPGNIMLTPERHVRLVDFGLAKRAHSEDESLSLTTHGAIAGTAAYMSPEQAEGKRLDARSDIFSFGTVLYEMTTGRRPFRAETLNGVLAAVIHNEPSPIPAQRPGTPAELVRIIGRCMRKDPARRYQVIDDARIAVEDVDTTVETAPAVSATRGSRSLTVLAAVTGLLVGVLLTLTATFVVNRRTVANAGPKITRLTSDPGLSTDPAFSPDGKLVAYVSDRGAVASGALDLWVRQTNGGTPVQLTHDGLDNREPSFSPDSASIVFRSAHAGGGIFVVSALGGEPRRIAERGNKPRFSPDGEQVVYWTGRDVFLGSRDSQKIWLVPSGGGSPREISSGFAVARSPVWSPDGKKILFLGVKSMDADAYPEDAQLDWWVASLDGRSLTPLLINDLLKPLSIHLADPAVWTADNAILFTATLGDARNIWRIPIANDGTRFAGPPERLTVAGGVQAGLAWAASRLAFSVEEPDVDLWSFPADTDRGEPRGAMTQITKNTGVNLYPSVSLDGMRMISLSDRRGAFETWFKDFRTGKETPIFGSGGDLLPFLTPDGRTAMYSYYDDKVTSVYLMNINGDGSFAVPRKICADCLNPWNLSNDARVLLFSTNFQQHDIYSLDIESGRKTKVIDCDQPLLGRPRFSPDNRWIAFHQWHGSSMRVFVVPYDGTLKREDKWVPITDGKNIDYSPYWSPNGELLYFYSDRDGNLCVWAQRLDAQSKRPAGEPFAVEHFHSPLRSLQNMSMVQVGMSVTRDQIFLNAGAATGNIWMADYSYK
ncbi:MAG: serine/threonine-protein kinase [Acidobacteriaceae bacterium]|nr:serine/threonine-protein kinase [Acidobacteriaceae bacterium]